MNTLPPTPSPIPAGELFKMGAGSYGNPLILRYGGTAKVTIGNYCSIADQVVILVEAEHHTEWVGTSPHLSPAPVATKGNVTIGHDVWIGYRTMILSGVTIGNGAVIGAGAVVAGDIPPYAIAVGNPARVARYRFAPDVIAKLETIRWWNWPPERIARMRRFLAAPPSESVLCELSK